MAGGGGGHSPVSADAIATSDATGNLPARREAADTELTNSGFFAEDRSPQPGSAAPCVSSWGLEGNRRSPASSDGGMGAGGVGGLIDSR